MIKHLTYEEILELAQQKENSNIELKNSSYLVLDHPFNKDPDKSKLITKFKEMIGKTISAFSNSAGGFLFIGINDDGSIDETSITEKFASSNTAVDKWVEDQIKSALQPVHENINCYLVNSDSDNRILVVEIPASDKAPHQSLIDNKYYIRVGKSSLPAEHWLIESIRNRRIHPRLEAELDFDLSRAANIGTKREDITLNLLFKIKNSGSILAKEIAAHASCLLANNITLGPPNLYEPVGIVGSSGKNEYMVKFLNTVFPEQETRIIAWVNVPIGININGDKSLSSVYFKIDQFLAPEAYGKTEDGFSHWFNVKLTLYADSAPPVIKTFQIDNVEFYPKFKQLLVNEGLVK